MSNQISRTNSKLERVLKKRCTGPISSAVDPWHFGTDPDPRHWLTDPDPIFRQLLTRCQQKIIFFPKFFFAFLLLLEGTVHSHHSSKVKSKKKHKIVEIKVFLPFFACLWTVQIMKDPEGPKRYGSGSTTLPIPHRLFIWNWYWYSEI